MGVNLAGVFAEAGALLRRERDLLLRVAAVFYFLPILALLLFAAPPDTAGMEEKAAVDAIAAWLNANAYWLLGQGLAQMLGTAVVLVLLLDSARPTVAQALLRALRLFPSLLAASLCAGVLVMAGALLFILPGIYANGRTFVTSAALIAEPGRGPIAAVTASIQRTRGRGWLLAVLYFIVWIANSFTTTTLKAAGKAAHAGPVLDVVVMVATAAIMSAAALALVLLQAAAYRLLPVPKQGI